MSDEDCHGSNPSGRNTVMQLTEDGRVFECYGQDANGRASRRHTDLLRSQLSAERCAYSAEGDDEIMSLRQSEADLYRCRRVRALSLNIRAQGPLRRCCRDGRG